jgi:hypothetical protein
MVWSFLNTSLVLDFVWASFGKFPKTSGYLILIEFLCRVNSIGLIINIMIGVAFW